ALRRPAVGAGVGRAVAVVARREAVEQAARASGVVALGHPGADQERRARVEHLVLLVPARELRTDRVPRQLEELDALLALPAGRLDVPAQVRSRLRVVVVPCRRRELDEPATAQITQ